MRNHKLKPIAAAAWGLVIVASLANANTDEVKPLEDRCVEDNCGAQDPGPWTDSRTIKGVMNNHEGKIGYGPSRGTGRDGPNRGGGPDAPNPDDKECPDPCCEVFRGL